MRAPLFPIIGFLLSGALTASPPGMNQASPAAQFIAAYEENEEGFRSQMNSILQAFRAGNDAEGRQLIEELRFPNAGAFFAENFAQDESVRLSDRYSRAFEDYAVTLEHTVKDVVRHREAEMTHRLIPGEPNVPTQMAYKLTSLTPQQEQTLYRFRSAIQLKGKDASAWKDTYVYRDGRFVFAGFGAWPLWSWNESSEPHAFTKGHFVTPPEPIRQIAPNYPRTAKKQKIEGTVVLKIRVGKDGSVGKIDVVSGDPQLVSAAVEAVQQWKYQPGTMGGSAIEAEQFVNVVFSLPCR